MRTLLHIIGILFAAAGCTRKETVPYTPEPFIADPVFLAYCQANFDFNGDGYFAKSEAAMVEEIDLGNEIGASADVVTLSGIRYFAALQRLDVSGNSIEQTDLSANTQLTLLNFADNKLAGLDLAANTLLETVDCRANPIMELDVTKCTGLEVLDCSDCDLTELDISTCTSLRTFSCEGNTSGMTIYVWEGFDPDDLPSGWSVPEDAVFEVKPD